MFNKKAPAKGKGFKQRQDINMLSFGTMFLDEGEGKVAAKGRIIWRKIDDEIAIEDDKEVMYTKEEALSLVTQALALDRAISFYLYSQDNGSLRGNARINIFGLEAKSPAKASVKAKAKPVYEVPAEEEAEEENPF